MVDTQESSGKNSLFFNFLILSNMPSEEISSVSEDPNATLQNTIRLLVAAGMIVVSAKKVMAADDCIPAGVIMQKTCGKPCSGVSIAELKDYKKDGMAPWRYPKSVLKKGEEGYALYHDGTSVGLEFKTIAPGKIAIVSTSSFDGTYDTTPIYKDARRSAIKNGEVNWNDFINDKGKSGIDAQVVSNCGVQETATPSSSSDSGCFVNSARAASAPLYVPGEILLRETKAWIEQARVKMVGFFSREGETAAQ